MTWSATEGGAVYLERRWLCKGSVVSMEPAQGALWRRVRVAYRSNTACIFTSLPIDHLALSSAANHRQLARHGQGSERDIICHYTVTVIEVFFGSLEADSSIFKLRDDGKEHSIAAAVISCLFLET